MQNEPHFTEEELAIARRVAAAYGRKGGLTKSEARAKASAENGRLHGGRPPSTPDGVVRMALRFALEEILGKPLPKEGAVARLVHKMSSARTLRRVWPAVAEKLPPNEIEPVRAKMEELVAVLESTGGPTARKAPAPAPAPSPTPPVWGGGWGRKPAPPQPSGD